MRGVPFAVARLVVLLALIPRPSPAADVVINELMASNSRTLTNSLGETSDWIELYNPTTNLQSMAGWFLTDDVGDPTKWALPATNLYPGAFLVVQASDHSPSITNGEVHAPFSLKADGEYLGLVATDGVTVVSEYAPEFPEQRTDIAYGIVPETATHTIVADSSSGRYLIPADGTLGTNWIAPGFDDSLWTPAAAPFGYESQPGAFSNLIATTVPISTRGIYTRFAFTLTNSATFDRIVLALQCDDGFVAYLDGQIIGSRHAPAAPLWNSLATTVVDTQVALQFAEFGASGAGPTLAAGPHVLAIHGLNGATHPANTDMLLNPMLVGHRRTGGVTELRQYMSAPTPGRPNSLEPAQLAEAVVFSRPGGLITNQILLALSVSSPSAQIRYTLNGNAPTETSTLYSAPILIGSNRHVRARAYDSGRAPGPIGSQSYLMLAPGVLRDFNSNLPIMVVDTLGRQLTSEVGDPAGTNYPVRPVYTVFIDAPDGGRAALTNTPARAGRAGMKVRGSSSATFAKKSFRLETWDDADSDEDVALLGLPAASDWVLIGSYFDKSLMRVTLMSKWYRRLGRYAPNMRYVEVYMDQNSGMVTTNDYMGLYVLEDRLEVGPNRINITPLRVTDVTMPDISGGYLLKFDRPDQLEGTLGWCRGDSCLCYVDPDYDRMPAAQRNWPITHLLQFESVLNGVNFTNPVTGYPAYVDIPSFIDTHIMADFSKDTDFYRHSTYFYKDRNGKLTMGPPWDVDHTLANISTSGGANPVGWWNYRHFSDNHYDWWERMFTDPNFYQAWVDRWDELLNDQFAIARMAADIDETAALLNEAASRNFARWPILGQSVFPGADPIDYAQRTTYASEVTYLRDFVSNRLAWAKSFFPAPPVMNPPGGLLANGTAVTATAAAGFTVYVTANGADPRTSGGGIAAGATTWTVPRAITNNVLLRVRARNGSGLWSAPRQAAFVVSTPALAITEVMYRPAAPPPGSPFDRDEFEFVEIQNRGAAPANLNLVTFTRGIDFTFPAVALDAGAHAVVVRNLAAFASRYNTNGMTIAGVYTGALDNAGEELQLETSISGPVLASFRYEDQRGWPVAADGAGHALVPLVFDAQTAATLNHGGNWRAGTYRGGSPGAADPESPAGVLLNEIEANTDYTNAALPEYDSNDRIELFNGTGDAQALTNWYLSDDPDVLNKWPLPAGDVIAAQGWRVYDEVSGFHQPITTGFGISKLGETLLLSHLPGGGLDRVADAVALKAQEAGFTWGRYPDGGWWVPMRPTLGAANTPREGGVVITEIALLPASPTGTVDVLTPYVEIFNPHATTTHCASAAGAWRVDGSSAATFPGGFALPPGGRALLVAFNPTNTAQRSAFAQRHGISATTNTLIGALTPQLPVLCGRIAVESPLAPDLPEDQPAWGIVDEAIYGSTNPWPATVPGVTLQRRYAGRSGSDPANWLLAPPSPLAGTLADARDLDADGLDDAWERRHFGATEGAGGGTDGDGDGMTDDPEYTAGTDPTNAADRLTLAIAWSNATGLVSWWGAEPASEFYTNSRRLYALDVASNVPAPSWFTVPGFLAVTGANASIAYSNGIPGGIPLFYRARVWLE